MHSRIRVQEQWQIGADPTSGRHAALLNHGINYFYKNIMPDLLDYAQGLPSQPVGVLIALVGLAMDEWAQTVDGWAATDPFSSQAEAFQKAEAWWREKAYGHGGIKDQLGETTATSTIIVDGNMADFLVRMVLYDGTPNWEVDTWEYKYFFWQQYVDYRAILVDEIRGLVGQRYNSWDELHSAVYAIYDRIIGLFRQKVSELQQSEREEDAARVQELWDYLRSRGAGLTCKDLLKRTASELPTCSDLIDVIDEARTLNPPHDQRQLLSKVVQQAQAMFKCLCSTIATLPTPHYLSAEDVQGVISWGQGEWQTKIYEKYSVELRANTDLWSSVNGLEQDWEASVRAHQGEIYYSDEDYDALISSLKQQCEDAIGQAAAMIESEMPPVTSPPSPPEEQGQIAELMPTADFHFEPTEPHVGDVVQFYDDSTSPPEAPIIKWEWHFGDGETSAQHNPEHSYSQAGTYAVRLWVTNQVAGEEAGSDEHTTTITVKESISASVKETGEGPGRPKAEPGRPSYTWKPNFDLEKFARKQWKARVKALRLKQGEKKAQKAWKEMEDIVEYLHKFHPFSKDEDYKKFIGMALTKYLGAAPLARRR